VGVVRNRIGAAAVLLWLAACNVGGDESPSLLAGGDPARGHEAVRRYGCQSCHTIPGVRAAKAVVGPPLAGIGSRSYIAGVLPNTPDNLVRWIRNPPSIDDRTAMPFLGVTEADARDIATYLYSYH
jgi:cytochrome c